MITLIFLLAGLVGAAVLRKPAATQTQVTTGLPTGRSTPDFHPTSQIVRATSQMIQAGQFQGGPFIFNPRNNPAVATGGPQAPTGGPSAPAYGGAGGTGTGGIGRAGRIFSN